MINHSLEVLALDLQGGGKNENWVQDSYKKCQIVTSLSRRFLIENDTSVLFFCVVFLMQYAVLCLPIKLVQECEFANSF